MNMMRHVCAVSLCTEKQKKNSRVQFEVTGCIVMVTSGADVMCQSLLLTTLDQMPFCLTLSYKIQLL